MTKEEAIKLAKEVTGMSLDWDDAHYEALQMAIKALEKEPILDKIRADVIARYPKNYAGELELGGRACEFSINQILQIIDKYKTETEGEE